MRLTLRALSALLAYPSADLQAHMQEVRDALVAEKALTPAALRALEPLLRSMETQELLDLQAEYSELFDRSRSLSLHLFEHVHGDSRERGPAMIDLGQRYIDHGCLLQDGELPDFTPVFLEFASLLPPGEAVDLLCQPAHVFAALEERLAKRESPYAAIFHAVLVVARARPDSDAVTELQQRAPSDDPANIDEEWQEAAVKFSSPSHEMGGPTGLIAKYRAAGRALGAALKR